MRPDLAAASFAAGTFRPCVALLAGCAAVPHGAPRLAQATGGEPRPDRAGAARPRDWWTALGVRSSIASWPTRSPGSPTLAAAAARSRRGGGRHRRPARRAPAAGERRCRGGGGRPERHLYLSAAYAGTARWIGTAQANLGWSLDLAGRQKAAVDQAPRHGGRRALDAAAARVVISGAVAQTAMSTSPARRSEADRRRVRRIRAAQSLDLARARVKSQLGSDIDLRTAETLLADAERAAARADGERALMVHALAALAAGAGRIVIRPSRPRP